jgi:cytochrome c551
MRVLSLLAGVALVIVVAARSSQPIAASAAPDANIAYASSSSDSNGDPINGRKVFLRENCYGCHGIRAGGGMCPNLRDDPPDESDVEHAVTEGTATGMPSFTGRITEREIADLAAYFQTLRTVREPTFNHWWEPGTPTR